jgi:hypothetical protein
LKAPTCTQYGPRADEAAAAFATLFLAVPGAFGVLRGASPAFAAVVGFAFAGVGADDGAPDGREAPGRDGAGATSLGRAGTGPAAPLGGASPGLDGVGGGAALGAGAVTAGGALGGAAGVVPAGAAAVIGGGGAAAGGLATGGDLAAVVFDDVWCVAKSRT